ncbi:hypothetical protein [Sciscionella marina]|uniref:hypothetical protein n=1 Tax=Sciscionella marina TaxID=508770 RepID=UPI000378DE0D|nr:hypothetical protein [Sciscionella marina]
MFNPLSAHELAMILSTVLRGSARWDRPLEPFETAQLLSASSIAKYLSAELAGQTATLSTFRDDLASELRDELDRQPQGTWADGIRTCLAGLDTDDPRNLGKLIGELLDTGRGQPELDRFRPQLHRLLGELASKEVSILASAGKSGGTK